ncbi:MAG: hypothetical protein ABR528_08750 [Pseudonocardiaceae bacterium]
MTVQSAGLETSAELVSLLDQVSRLAGAAGRSDPVERLARARARVVARLMRVLVLRVPGQGATSLVQILEQESADRVPGASFVDAAGPAGSNQPVVPDPGSMDVVLFVSDAGQQYSPVELDALARIRAQGTVVVGVLTKIDAYPRWAEVQRANRSGLQAANLDSPTIPLLPVSSALGDSARQRGDESLSVASGIPQLLDFLRDRIGIRVDPVLRDWVLGEVRAVTDQLSKIWTRELDGLQGAGDSAPQRAQRAVAELERRQQLSAQWQLALSDGVTELMAQVDFDLRERLRAVMELAEEQITQANPVRQWPQFDKSMRGKVEDSVQANFQLAAKRSLVLAAQVAAKLAGNPDGSPTGVALPQLRIAGPDEALGRVKPMEPPNTGGGFARLVNSLRGSYGGILMVGVMTSLAGLALISVWSVAAGVLLGLFTFWEDRKNGHERGKAEAKMAVSKMIDNVNFRVGDELRAQLRAVHRALRDHFTEVNDQRLRTAADAVRAAAQTASANSGQRDPRLSQLHNYLAELRQLRIRATPPTADRLHPTAQRGTVMHV